MPEYKVTIEIVDILEEGNCPLGHQIGEKFEYPADRGKICEAAFHSIFPTIRVLESGGSYSWYEDEGNSNSACCPDYKRPVVFKMTRKKV